MRRLIKFWNQTYNYKKAFDGNLDMVPSDAFLSAHSLGIYNLARQGKAGGIDIWMSSYDRMNFLDDTC